MSQAGQLLKKLFRWGSKTEVPTELNYSDLVGLGGSASLVSMETSYYERMRLPYTREDMYRLYEELDEMAEVSGVLWAYAEDALQRELNLDKVVWFRSDNREIVKELDKLFYETLDVDDWSLPAVRDLGKYGDNFSRLVGREGEGLLGIADWPFPHYVKRVENQAGVLLGFLDEFRLRQLGEKKMTSTDLADVMLKPWEMVHFRLRAQNRVPRNEERWVYGTSLLYPIRRAGRRMMLFTDILFLYRLKNSFDRRVYYIDVGTEDVQQIKQIIKNWRRALEKNQYVNWDEHLMRITSDPMSLGEQTFWPRRSGSDSSVETIPGDPNVADMADIDREENSLFAGMRAPKEYFGFGRDGGVFDRDKGLTLKDMRWGRSVSALQRAFRIGIHRMGCIHLALKHIDPRDPKNRFEVRMVSPSVLETLQNLQAASDLSKLADDYFRLSESMGLNPDRWRKYVLRRFLGFSGKEIEFFTTDPVTDEPIEPPDVLPGQTSPGGGGKAPETSYKKEPNPLNLPGGEERPEPQEKPGASQEALGEIEETLPDLFLNDDVSQTARLDEEVIRSSLRELPLKGSMPNLGEEPVFECPDLTRFLNSERGTQFLNAVNQGLHEEKKEPEGEEQPE